jgi:hypothetical protein
VSVETFPAAPVNTFRRRVGQNKKNSEKGRRFIAVVFAAPCDGHKAIEKDVYRLHRSNSPPDSLIWKSH